MLNQKIKLGLATREEFLKQIKTELNMLDTCQLKIEVRILQLILIKLLLLSILFYSKN